MGHPHPKIVCHRGVKTFAPENTPLAIDLAIGLGFNIVEIDVRQTKDGVPVVLHDSSANRTTDGSGEIKEMNYADVCKLDAGSWFNPFFAGELVPRLEDGVLEDELENWIVGETEDGHMPLVKKPQGE